MTDHLSQKQRSWNMRRIKSKHSKAEVLIRCMLYRAGFRYRVNDKSVIGCPDIVLKKYNTVIFIHGCFWHRHKGCSKTTTPSSNKEYWLKKFKRNVERDRQIEQELTSQGWNLLILWECEILLDPATVINRVIGNLRGCQYLCNISNRTILKIAEKRHLYLSRKK